MINPPFVEGFCFSDVGQGYVQRVDANEENTEKQVVCL